jgi:D-alanyl-lipoteichoic acid acyltransferase DltB (MBOAT superfamily)
MSVDLASPPFWVALCLAYLVLTPVTDLGVRRRLLCLINFGFVAWLLGLTSAFILALGLSLALVLIRGLANKRDRQACLIALVLGLTVTFAIAKRRDWAVLLTLGPASQALSAIGFSYILLRVVYLCRAVWEQRAQPPGPYDFINYLLPFSMLAAGPIATYEEYRNSDCGLATREDILCGMERIANGLLKKFVLASGLQVVFLSEPGTGNWFLEMQVSYLWLYLDFSGYSDIAVGAGRLLGLRVPENFDRPLMSSNLIEFWQRWHISLSSFVKTEIFMPLQFALMRGSLGTRPLLTGSLCFTVAFLLCGLWHGIDARFLAWGLLHGAGLSICKAYQTILVKRLGRAAHNRLQTNPLVRAVGTVLTFEFVAFSWYLVSGLRPGLFSLAGGLL